MSSSPQLRREASVAGFLPVNKELAEEPPVNKSSEQRVFRVAVNGLPYFCQKLSQLLNGEEWEVPHRSPSNPVGLAARFVDLARCDLAYSWTGRISMGRFLKAARALGKKKIVMLWSGSDALWAKAEWSGGKTDPWVRGLVHWAVSPWLAEEVCSLGIDCEYVQASFVDIVPHVKPLPKKFSVLAFVRDIHKTGLYGWDRILEVAQKLPQIEFNLCGLPEGQRLQGPPNIKVHNWTNGLTTRIEQTSVVYRPVRHDGLSFTVLEALSHGRHVLYTYPLPGCIQVADAAAACQELEKLYACHKVGALPLNENGRRYVIQEYAPAKVRSEIRRRWKQIILS